MTILSKYRWARDELVVLARSATAIDAINSYRKHFPLGMHSAEEVGCQWKHLRIGRGRVPAGYTTWYCGNSLMPPLEELFTDQVKIPHKRLILQKYLQFLWVDHALRDIQRGVDLGAIWFDSSEEALLIDAICRESEAISTHLDGLVKPNCSRSLDDVRGAVQKLCWELYGWLECGGSLAQSFSEHSGHIPKDLDVYSDKYGDIVSKMGAYLVEELGKECVIVNQAADALTIDIRFDGDGTS